MQEDTNLSRNSFYTERQGCRKVKITTAYYQEVGRAKFEWKDLTSIRLDWQHISQDNRIVKPGKAISRHQGFFCWLFVVFLMFFFFTRGEV